jgi:hypothetical protein
MEILDLVLGAFLGVAIGGGIGYLAGKWFDIHWRAKFQRNSMKKEMMIFRILNKDKHSMREMLVNVEGDYKLLKDKGFLCENGRIWRTNLDNLEVLPGGELNLKGKKDEKTGEEMPINKDDGFMITSPETIKKVKWEQGVPILYIDEDSFRPIDFYEDSTNKTNPKNVANMLSTLVNIEVARKLANKTQDIFTILIIVGLVANIFLSYSTSGSVSSIDTRTGVMNDRITSIEAKQNEIYGNDTEVIPSVKRTMGYSDAAVQPA